MTSYFHLFERKKQRNIFENHSDNKDCFRRFEYFRSDRSIRLGVRVTHSFVVI